MKNYRILQIHNFYQIPGGEDVVVRNEKRLLEEHGHKVYTYYRSNSELAKKGIVGKLFLPFTAVFSLKTYREVKKLIRENQIDIVHVHNTLTMVSPSVFYAAFRCKVPVVQTLHNFRMLCPAGSFFRDNVICEECVQHGMGCAIRHKCYRNSKLQSFVSAAILQIHRFVGTYRRVNFICLTEFNRKKLLESLDTKKEIVNPERVYIKPNFTFAEEIVPNEVRSDEEYFLFAGRVEALKGIDIAVGAFEKLPDKKLYVAGNGPMMEEMQRAIREHPIDPGKDTVYYFIQDLFHVLDENRQIASALVGPHGDIGFVHKLEQLLEDKSRESLAALVPEKSGEMKYFYSYCLNGCLGFVKTWLETGEKETPEYAAEMAYRMVVSSVTAFYDTKEGREDN